MRFDDDCATQLKAFHPATRSPFAPRAPAAFQFGFEKAGRERGRDIDFTQQNKKKISESFMCFFVILAQGCRLEDDGMEQSEGIFFGTSLS